MRLHPRSSMFYDFDNVGGYGQTWWQSDPRDNYAAVYFDEYSGRSSDGRQLVILRNPHSPVDAHGHTHGVFALNPAAFTHYSYAIRDACAMLTAPLIEVHLSNPLSREEFRHTSVVSGVATGSISGFGADSYRLALRALAGILSQS
jgi:hypothetical protein